MLKGSLKYISISLAISLAIYFLLTGISVYAHALSSLQENVIFYISMFVLLISLVASYLNNKHDRACEIRTMKTLLLFIDSKDHITYSHSMNVGGLATMFALYLGLIRKRDAAFFDKVAKIHDIGKMSVPDTILQKSAPLTPEEFEIIKQHPITGDEILMMLLGRTEYRSLVLHHHERYDGTGYPFGLQGESIPYSARMLAIIDNFEALSQKRPYRHAYEYKQVLHHLRTHSGSHFDPALLDEFLTWIDIYPVMATYARLTLHMQEDFDVYFVSCDWRSREMVVRAIMPDNEYIFTLYHRQNDWHVSKVRLEAPALAPVGANVPV